MEFGKVIKTFTSKKGHTIIFRYPKEEDAQAMLDFINALIAEDTFIAVHSQFKTLEEEQKFLDSIVKDMDDEKKIHLAVERDGAYIGNAEIRRGDHRSLHVGELGIALLQEYRDEGIGSELIATLIDLAKKMKLRLLTLNCFENNHRALHLYHKLGFRRGGMIPHAILYKGEYLGEVKMYFPLAVDALPRV